MLGRLPASLLFGSILAAQTPRVSENVLQNTGAPLSISFACTNDDLEWAGLTCTDEACPIYVDLTSAAGQGDVVFVAGNFHAVNATLYSVLLATSDGGRTWREPVARIRGVSFERIQALDGLTAVISGEMMQPLPMDPFFLLTSDGGKTWDRVPLFEQGTPGLIRQFSFDSKDHGKALVDLGAGDARYEVYETQTGGREWTIREKSATLPKFPDSAVADWRLRAEPKRFRLEKLEDSHWSPFASFLIAAANCKETPPPPAPEPSVQPTAANEADDAVSEIRLDRSKDDAGKKRKPQQ